jgi:hypothetical protein
MELRRAWQGLPLCPDRGRGDFGPGDLASAAMATSGSENFFKAHFERGGMR